MLMIGENEKKNRSVELILIEGLVRGVNQITISIWKDVNDRIVYVTFMVCRDDNWF
jgi:hypothetical protein